MHTQRRNGGSRCYARSRADPAGASYASTFTPAPVIEVVWRTQACSARQVRVCTCKRKGARGMSM